MGLLKMMYSNDVLYVWMKKKKTSSRGMSNSFGPTMTWLG